MPRAEGNDLCEIFGYAPDDTSEQARRQWKSQNCPFVGNTCIKHSHPQEGSVVVYGSCSIVNRAKHGIEEVIICPQRLYANSYESLKRVVWDSVQTELPLLMAVEYAQHKKAKVLPDDFVVALGQHSGKEIMLSNPGFISLSFDWVLVRVVDGKIALIIPCEVQSIDITRNYRANWDAYSRELPLVPDSKHGMNWANVWKRLIPQLILKGSMASTSQFCQQGMYFVVPDRVYRQFEKLIGEVVGPDIPERGVLTVMTYDLGSVAPFGTIRSLLPRRTIRMHLVDFAEAFASGKQLPLGSQLDEKVGEVLANL